MKIKKKAVLVACGTLAAICLIVAGGCANVQRGKGFDEVAREVGERAGATIHWDNGTDADDAVRKSVDEMLKGELTADEAVQIALLNNHELQAIYEELNIAQADVVQAGLLKNPVFSGEVRLGTSGGGTGVVLDVAQDFLSMLWLPMRKGVAEAEFEAAKIRVTNAVLDAAYATRMTFYEYESAEQLHEMRTTVTQVTEASYELAKRIREAGNNRELDVLNEQAMHEQAKLDLADTETHAMMLRERMNALMGLWGSQTEWKTAGRLEEFEDEEKFSETGVEGEAIAANLELAELRREAEMRARRLGLTKRLAWMDGTEVGVAAEQELEGEWSVGPSFSIPVPLFDMGQASRAKAEAELRQTAAAYWARAVEIRSR
ncbi:MAG TPA: TolC family protein, partial [Phycisphaerales bacterium]|nr:TolC family protein [Phycisphaerales bacterium]